LEAKRGLNRRLLLQTLADVPVATYIQWQLRKAAAVCGEYAQAQDPFARAASLHTLRRSQRLVLMATPVQLRGPYQQAHEFVVRKAQMTGGGDSPDFCFALGDLMLYWAADKPVLAKRLPPTIEPVWRRCLLVGECLDLATESRASAQLSIWLGDFFLTDLALTDRSIPSTPTTR